MKTLYLGPDELMLGAKISVAKNASGEDISKTINAAEDAVRAAVAATRVIYLEPDLKRESAKISAKKI